MADNAKTNNHLTLPLLVTRGLIVFPNLDESIEAGRAFSVKAVDYSRENTNSLMLITCQKDPEKNDINQNDICEYGALCRIVNFVPSKDLYRIRVIGTKRVSLDNVYFKDGTYLADATILEDNLGDRKEENRLVGKIMDLLSENTSLVGRDRDIPRSFMEKMNKGISANELSDMLASHLPLSIEQKLTLLKETDVNQRLEIVLTHLNEQVEISQIDQKINNTVRERAEKQQKEYILREKMKAIKDELGEGANSSNSEDSIREKLEKNPYPQNVKDKVKKELARYDMMPESSLESSLIMNYIETLLNVPWFEKTDDNEDLNNARAILDEDHFGLSKVKERIIEYLAVKKSTQSLKAPILCFYGPPGCGKTSLGKSIARALGRKFFKCSLGGISDEAEIRGHRRTYVGSMPGRIIQGMSRVGVKNPVFLLDEIDKLGGASYHGDPASAMLEVLDPEQNSAFNDNYLEEPYDLSEVLFLCTANYIENVPGPLRDRLELIEVPSYTEPEKVKIACDFLVKKQSEANGIKEGDIVFEESGIKEIIECYTREAGVRQLERLIASCCRKAIVEILSNPETKRPIVIDEEQVKKYLGVEIFEDTKKEKEPQIGVITGMAYTEFGGDILPIEATYFPGKGGLVLTGKLGDVMKESAMIAIDYVRANAKKYGIDDEIFQKNDIHIHFPEGAVPKDGPSAGVAITCAIISCLTHTYCDNNVAMTGEVTLRGQALPIGGLREKSLAALRCGIKTIIVPEENKKDVSELPQVVKDNLKIVYMKKVDDAAEIALLSKKAE